MEHLGIPPGPTVGKALAHLMEIRLDEGEIGEEEAVRRLDQWWADRQGSTPAPAEEPSGKPSGKPEEA